MNQKGYLQNLHTHTIYCDGKDTPEELALAAIQKGFDSLGFSGHSYTFFRECASSMPAENEAAYKREVAKVKETYQDQLAVYCGLELDGYSIVDTSGYDYIIGSMHYIQVDGVYRGVDHSVEETRETIEEYFGGDGLRYVRAYYDALSKLTEFSEIDFVGHFDLVTKFCEVQNFFDAESKEYKKYALDALDVLTSKFRLFEINSGAISRGYRKTPYPAPFILKELKKRNCGILIGADCHDRQYLDCYFKEAEELMKACGFQEKYVLTQKGFTAVPLTT